MRSSLERVGKSAAGACRRIEACPWANPHSCKMTAREQTNAIDLREMGLSWHSKMLYDTELDLSDDNLRNLELP